MVPALCLFVVVAGCGGTRIGAVRGIDQQHKDISRGIADIVDATDRAFGESRVEDRERLVKVAVGGQYKLRENRDPELGLRLSLRLPFPALERRANIFLEIESTVDDTAELESIEEGATHQASASILTQLTKPFSLGTKLGIEWDDGPQGFVRPFLRYESHHDPWRYYGEQQVYLKTDDGFGGKTIGQFDRLLTEKTFIRFFASGEYHENLEGIDMDMAVLYRRPFIAKSILSYEAGVDFNTENFHEDEDEENETFLQIRWIGRIWKPWLEYEIRPVLFIPWDAGDHFEYGALFGLTILFEDYLRPRSDTDSGVDTLKELPR